MYPHQDKNVPDPKASQPGNFCHHLEDKYHNKSRGEGYVVTNVQQTGFSLAQIIASIPRGAAAAEFDFGMVICNLNAPSGQSQKDLLSELSSTGAEVLELIRISKTHRRFVVVFGGSGALWGAPNGWDLMVRNTS